MGYSLQKINNRGKQESVIFALNHDYIKQVTDNNKLSQLYHSHNNLLFYGFEDDCYSGIREIFVWPVFNNHSILNDKNNGSIKHRFFFYHDDSFIISIININDNDAYFEVFDQRLKLIQSIKIEKKTPTSSFLNFNLSPSGQYIHYGECDYKYLDNYETQWTMLIKIIELKLDPTTNTFFIEQKFESFDLYK